MNCQKSKGFLLDPITPEEETRLINCVAAIHCGQLYGIRPYIEHIKDVIGVAKRFGFNGRAFIATAGFHDSVEDQGVTVADLERELIRIFGVENGPHFTAIIDSVISVTDFTKEELKEVPGYREDSPLFAKRVTFQMRTATDPVGIVVKLCDRVANVEGSMADEVWYLVDRYVKEWPLFENCLLRDGDTRYLRDSYLPVYLRRLVKDVASPQVDKFKAVALDTICKANKVPLKEVLSVPKTDLGDPVQLAAAASDLLAMVDTYVKPETVITWSADQLDAAKEWAIATHLRASDNDVEVPKRPNFLPPIGEGRPDVWEH